jgi:hypothetical protein
MKRTQRLLPKIVVAGSAVLMASSAVTTVSADAGPSAPRATHVAAASATTAMLPAGRQGSAASIPWSKVGPGWLLSQWSAKRTSAATLFLVDPLGGRYTITAGAPAPSGVLVAWSGDGTRALFEAQTSVPSNKWRVTVLELRGGRSTTFTAPGYSPGWSGRPVNFTEPDGLGVITGSVSSWPQDMGPVQRLDLQGGLEYTYPTSFPRAGRIQGGVLYSPDGTELVMGTTHGFEVVTNGGQPLRYLPMSASAGPCLPVSWWASGVVLASCAGQKLPAQLLWLVPTNGGPPTHLTLAGSVNDYGDADAWSLPSGEYVQDHGPDCTYLAKVGADRRTTPVSVPGRWGSVGVIGAYADELALSSGSGASLDDCGANTSLLWFNPATNKVTPLLGPRANGGSVGAAVLFGQTSALEEWPWLGGPAFA